MSGEYFCIEEVADSTSYYDNYETKSNVSSPIDRQNCVNVRDRDDARSTTSRKSQDFRLYEIEEQLEIAENRCNTLKGQLDSMKKIYSKAGKGDGISKTPETTLNLDVERRENLHGHRGSRKRHSSGSRVQNERERSRPGTPRKRSAVLQANYHESTDTIPQKSSNSSTAVPPVTNVSMMRPKEGFVTHLIRQNSYSIGTDDTGAAVRTINNILTGITDSVNRLSQLHTQDKGKKSKQKYKEPRGCAVFITASKSFSPRVQKRIAEQQKRVVEMIKGNESNDNNADSSAKEESESQKLSAVNIKSKSHVKGTWSRHTSSKLPTTKAKVQISSGSVNLKKTIKSTARAVENTTKMHSVRTGMYEDESHSGIISRKRKRGSVKRLKPSSKMTLGRKFSDQTTDRDFHEKGSDNNLVELYHNIAAKTSDSDDSNNINNKDSITKTQIPKQKGGGDLPIAPPQPISTFQVHTEPPIVPSRPVTNRTFTTRALTPINENGYIEQDPMITNDCFTKNYELPTIASKMKQVTKCYLQSFNFRSIPFCAAKSTSPSHNIGINIQQVMSIIKTRQPITGISPTLAHNISLAAGRLQSRPLSTLVSTLGSRIGYGPSQCPLVRSSLNYNQLEEMAKEVPEEPYEEQPGYAGDQSQNDAVETEIFANGPSGDREELNEPAVWTADSAQRQRCSCTTERGVPFQQILNKFQMSTESMYQRNQTSRYNIMAARKQQQRIPMSNTLRKQRARSWIKNDVNVNVSNTTQNMNNNNNSNKNNNQDGINKSGDGNSLQGKEKNLKTVLKNLHDEFDSLNTKYEQLAKQVNKNDDEASPDMFEELEKMEKALNKKEEEINMVMSLYTEVLALKDQVKRLRERTHSQASITLSKNPSKATEYKEPKAVLHLTQLLRQIQNYQMHCRSKV